MPVMQPKYIDMPGAAPRLSSAELLGAYATMLRIRRFEEKAAQLYAIGEIENLPPLSIGQEAILAAATAHAPGENGVAVVHPMAGLKIAQGEAPETVMAKLFKGVGAHAPRGASVFDTAKIIILDPALSDAERTEFLKTALSTRRGLVVISINANTDVSDALNLNAGHSLVCAEARDLGLDAQISDGNDIERLRHLIETAAANARASNTPQVIEALLHRYRGHSGGGRGSQGSTKPSLPREAIDPLARTRQLLVTSGAAAPEQISSLELSIREDIAASVTDARGLVATAPVKA